MSDYTIHTGDVLDVLPTLETGSINCLVTSPPYFGLRDYGVDGQIGLESTPDAYIEKMVMVFREVKRVLRDDGTLWLNLGDSYASATTGADTTKSSLGGGKATQTVGGKRPDKLGFGIPEKNLLGIPWRVALALQADGWYLRQDIIWHKPNPMPESVRDRCTKAHEYIFLLSKSARYYYDQDAVKEPLAESSIARLSQDIDNQQGSDRVPGKTNGAMKAVSAAMTFRRDNSKRAAVHPGQTVGTHRPDREDTVYNGFRNRRSVWTVTTKPFKEAHFAVFPPDLIRPCILAGCPKGGTVLDPFNGSGTTGVVCMEENRNYVGIELNPEYVTMARRRISQAQPQWFGAAL